MPYEAQWEPRGIYWRFHGTVEDRELLQANLDIYGDPRFESMRYQICDFLETRTLRIEPSTVKRLAYLDVAAARSNPQVKVAIITDRDLFRDFARMYATYADESPWQTRILDTVEEARAWLGA